MAYHNLTLHNATKSYVSVAIDLITQRAMSESSHSELSEDIFFFARLEANPELQELPEYQKCLRALTSDRTFTRQMKVLAGTRL